MSPEHAAQIASDQINVPQVIERGQRDSVHAVELQSDFAK